MPAQVGELLENPVAGERGVVRVAPNESNGDVLVADLHMLPGGAVTGEHVHPGLTEAFTLVRGRLRARRAGQEQELTPGVQWEAAAGVAHDFWNAGDEEARVLVEVQPAERLVLALVTCSCSPRTTRPTPKVCRDRCGRSPLAGSSPTQFNSPAHPGLFSG
jgi:quercetin dioxygenase-like cupin family protein